MDVIANHPPRRWTHTGHSPDPRSRMDAVLPGRHGAGEAGSYATGSVQTAVPALALPASPR